MRKVKTLEELTSVMNEITPTIGTGRKGLRYLYRGEPEIYDTVSSSLYRAIQEKNAYLDEKIGDLHSKKRENFIDDEDFEFRLNYYTDSKLREDCLTIQEQELNPAKDHKGVNPQSKEDLDVYSHDNLNLLAEIQHLGGKTMLIDFTWDPKVALFFACNQGTIRDGRIVILKEAKIPPKHIFEASLPLHRVMSQHSVFVIPREGYLRSEEFYEEIHIDWELKLDVIWYLASTQGITAESIYNDIIGYIEYQKTRLD